MKILLLLYIFVSTLLFSSVFVPIQPANLIADYKTKTTVLVYDQRFTITKNSKNLKALGSVGFSEDDWYVDNGWNKFKAYYPPGTGLSNIQFIARPNANYRIHLAFKVDDNPVIDHMNPDFAINMLSTKNTTEFLASDGKNITIDSDLINNNNGGWLYIFVVEDAANRQAVHGDVNPSILITTATIITDQVKYNNWLNNVDLLPSGSPGDAVSSIRVIERIKPTISTSHTFAMDLAVDPNTDKDGDSISPAQGDCNDYDNTIYPGAIEIVNDGIDQNCDGQDSIDVSILDQDNDGYTPAQGDCNDFNALINPGQSPIPNNGINDNCAQNINYEYTSLHPTDLLTDLSNKFATSNSVIISKAIAVNKQLDTNGTDWFAPNGWQSYKFFIPKGIDTARILASSTTQGSDFRIHAAFKANHNQTITHVSPVHISNPISNKETLEAVSANGAIELDYDKNFINGENGGYVYIDIANNPTGTSSDVNMQLMLQMHDHSIFDAWKYDVNVIFDDLPEDGDPEDSVLNMNIIDKISTTNQESRYVPMQRSLLTWSEYKNIDIVVSSSSSSASSSVSGIDCRAYVNWNNPQCTGDNTANSSVSVSSTPNTGSNSSLDCRAYVNWNNPQCTGDNTANSSVSVSSTPNTGSNSSLDCRAYANWNNPQCTGDNTANSSVSVSSTPNTGSNSSLDCRAYANWNNPICTDDKSGEEDEVTDPAIEIFTDISTIKEALSGNTYTLLGEFTEHDFDDDGSIDPFDWLYKDSYGFAQLRGNPATETNIFGWKDVTIETEFIPNWYMFALGSDVDGDGSTKFDWIIVTADSNSKQVYKLSGVTSGGTFRYSNYNIDLDYSFSSDRKTITFASLRPGERNTSD